MSLADLSSPILSCGAILSTIQAAAEQAQHSFGALDWLMLVLYGMVLLATGWFISHRHKQKSTADYFLAGHSMPAWAVAVSIFATGLSAATFIAAPEQAYNSNLTYLSSNIGQIMGAIFVAAIFVPVFYKARVITVYQLLEARVGRPARVATSMTYIMGRLLASGARLYIAAIAGSWVAFGDIAPGHVNLAVLAFAAVGVGYTLVGGVRSVIWTDVIQATVLTIAVVAALTVLFQRIPVPLSEIVQALRHGGPNGSSKLTVIDPSMNITGAYTLIAGVTGWFIFGIGVYGTDHDLAQRTLTCGSALKGTKSVITSIFIGLPVTALFLIIGVLLYIFYQRPDLMGAAAPATGLTPHDTRKVFLQFIMNQLPGGLPGLMMAGLFSAGLSSVNTTINAMASTITNDIYQLAKPGRSDAHYVRAGRTFVVMVGIALAGFAIMCQYIQQHSGTGLLDFAIAIMNFAYAGLVGVYLTTILTKKRGSNWSVIAAIIVGFTVVLLLQKSIWSDSMLERLGDYAHHWPAFPWVLLIATGCSSFVCLLGRSQAQPT